MLGWTSQCVSRDTWPYSAFKQVTIEPQLSKSNIENYFTLLIVLNFNDLNFWD